MFWSSAAVWAVSCCQQEANIVHLILWKWVTVHALTVVPSAWLGCCLHGYQRRTFDTVHCALPWWAISDVRGNAEHSSVTNYDWNVISDVISTCIVIRYCYDDCSLFWYCSTSTILSVLLWLRYRWSVPVNIVVVIPFHFSTLRNYHLFYCMFCWYSVLHYFPMFWVPVLLWAGCSACLEALLFYTVRYTCVVAICCSVLGIGVMPLPTPRLFVTLNFYWSDFCWWYLLWRLSSSWHYCLRIVRAFTMTVVMIHWRLHCVLSN